MSLVRLFTSFINSIIAPLISHETCKPITVLSRKFEGTEDEFEDFLDDICETTTDSNGKTILYINFAVLEQLSGRGSNDYCNFIQEEAYKATGKLVVYDHNTIIVSSIGAQLQWNNDIMVLCNIENIDQAVYWLESKTRQYYMN